MKFKLASMRDSRRTLRRRISTFLLLFVVLAVGSLDIASFFVESNYLNGADKAKLRGASYLVARSLLAEFEAGSAISTAPRPSFVPLKQSGSQLPPRGTRTTLFATGGSGRGTRIPNGTVAFLYSSKGQLLGRLTFGTAISINHLPQVNVVSARTLTNYSDETFFSIGSKDHSVPYLGLVRRLTLGRGYVVLYIPVSDSRSTLTTLAVTELAVTLLLVGLLLFASNVVIGREVMPLERLSSVAEEVSKGNLSVRADVGSKSKEIDSLVLSFNSMVGALEEQFRARESAAISLREFMASASHELNTPLTAILGFSEILIERGLTDEDRSTVNRIHEEALRLNLLVSDLLNISKFDKPNPLPRTGAS